MADELTKYSADWVRRELGDRDWMPLRRCSLCRQTIGYMQDGGQLYYSSACGCSSYDGLNPREWQDIADTLAMQKSDEIRDRIMETLKGERESA